MAARWERWLRTRMRRGWHRFWDWLFKPPFDRALVEEEVLQDICALAKGSYPKEMIAFLTGEIRKEKMEIEERKEEPGKKGRKRRKARTERLLIINGLYVKGYYADHTSTNFTTHDLPMLDVYGTVHSHPSGNVRPSMADRRLFASFGWFHLIVGKPYTQESIAFYDKRGERIG